MEELVSAEALGEDVMRQEAEVLSLSGPQEQKHAGKCQLAQLGRSVAKASAFHGKN